MMRPGMALFKTVFAGGAIMAFASMVAISSTAFAQSSSMEKAAEQKQQDQAEPTEHDPKPDPETPTATNQEPDSRPAVEKKQDGWWDKFIKWTNRNDKAVVALSTVIIGAFTVALFFATFLLWWAGERHSERELRVYVFVTEAAVYNFSTDQPLEARLNIHNAGQTPAYDFTIGASIDVHRLPRKDYFPFSDSGPFRSKGTLGPGVDLNVIRTIRRPLTGEEGEMIVRGDLAVSVFGDMTYCDAFKRERVTRFRFLFVGNGRYPGETLTLGATEEGNDST